jgi:FkbM family methyltransferase
MLITRIIRNIRRHMSIFGSIKGIVIYFKVKLNRTGEISLSNIQYPFKLRSASSDVAIFYQIFFDKQYAIKFPFEPRTIIDAGANIGLAAIYFTNRFPKAEIISIEPETTNFQLLEDNTTLYANIKRLNMALSSESDLELIVDSVGLGHSGFITTEVSKASEVAKNKIQTISIDRLLAESEFDELDIVKIDIEGHEKEVFELNAEKWLPKTKCLIIELHDSMKKGCSTSLFKAITRHNFSMEISGENLVFLNNDLVN